jgi:hypothetical protein
MDVKRKIQRLRHHKKSSYENLPYLPPALWRLAQMLRLPHAGGAGS